MSIIIKSGLSEDVAFVTEKNELLVTGSFGDGYNVAAVLNYPPADDAYGLVVRIAGSIGEKTNNFAPPDGYNLGTLPAVATSAAPTYTNGYQVALSTDLSGALRVAGSFSADTGVDDKTSFTYGTSIEQPIGGVYQDTSPSLTAGTTGAVRLTANRGFHVNLRDASGNQLLGSATSANSIPVVMASDQGSFTVAATQSGTWTVQQGSAPWSFVGNKTNNNAAPGATNLGALTALANASAPSWTEGNEVLLSVDLAGALRVGTHAVTQSGGPWTSNVTQFGSTNISTGTGASGAGIPRVTVSNDSNILATQSGSWAVTANIGTTNGLALDATLAKLTIAQGASLGSNTQALVGGSVTTAAPAYTTGQISPLSLTTTGLLRVDGSGVTQPVSGTITANAGTGTFTVAGGKTNNAAAPGATNVGVLPALANTSAPTWTDGNQVVLSTLLTGALRSDNTSWLGSTAPTVGSKTSANSIPVVVASDQGAIAVSQSGSWTVTANAGTGTFTVASNKTNNSAAPGATNLGVLPALANAAAPTWTEGNQVALSTDLGGALRVAGSFTANTGTADKTTFTYGSSTQQSIGGVFQDTSPTLTAGQSGAVRLTANRGFHVNLRDASGNEKLGSSTSANSIPVVVASDQGAIPVSQSGTWTVQQGSPPWSFTGNKTNNNAAPGTTNVGTLPALANAAAPTWTEGNQVALSTDLAGALRITGSVSASNPSVSTTGSAPPASATYIGGSVTTAAPTYTTGQMSALSLMTTGALRTDISSWIGSTAPTVGSKTSANSIPVVVASDQGAITVNASATVGLVDNAAFTDGTTRVQPVGFILDETAGTALTENDAAAARIDSKRAQIFVIEDGTTRGTRNTVKAASTAAVATDTALVVAISPNNTINISSPDTTGTGTLNALNAASSVALVGQNSVGMQLLAGTLVGTIVPEISIDGGTTWVATFFDDPSTGNKVASIVFGASNTATTRTIVGAGGASNARVRVSAFTSGTATCNIRATNVGDPSVLYTGSAGSALSPVINNVGGSVTTAAPTYTTGTMNSLSLTTTGALRVDGSGSSSPITGTIQPLYGTNNQTVTITLASLTNTSARASTAVSNTTNLYDDVYISVRITTAAAGTSATGFINVYGYGTVDGGTTYPEAITGTDAAITLTSPPNLVLIAQFNANTNGATKTVGPISFCRQYGVDRLPAGWGVVIVNNTGATLNATAGNHFVKYQGVNGQIT